MCPGKSARTIFMLCLAIFCCGALSAQTIRYVKQVSSGAGDGSSWANASSDLQLMINNSGSGDQVWVAKGTYKPNRQPNSTTITANHRDNTFLLKSGVKIYGSFAGNESTIEGRQFETNATILSGDFSGNDPNNTTNTLLINNTTLTSDNAHHVVVAINLSSNTVFDGFVITGGIANVSGSLSVNVTPTTTQNMLRSSGGGMYLISTSGLFSNIMIKASRTTGGGAGIYIHNGSSLAVPRFSGLIITGCVSGNGLGNGSAIYSAGTGSNQETKSEFFNMLVTNCAGDNAIYVTFQYTQVYISNATFYGVFTADTDPIYAAVITTNSAGYVTLANSIIAQHGYPYSFNIGASSFVSTRSHYNSVFKPKRGDGTLLVLNGTENAGDPGFVNAAAGNFNLASGSGSINAGNDSYLVTASGTSNGYPAISTDIVGNIRSRNTVDQGAYESNYNPNTIRYVKPVASGTGDGSSWANASSDLQLMLNQSNAGNQVWVAKGTYKPNRQPNSTAITANHRDNTFLLKSGVKVYGSFAGTESTIEGRQFETNATILSGDFSGNDPNNNNPVELLNESLTSDNAHHVVMGIKLSNASVFDGFVITGGAATTPSSLVVASTTQDVWRGNGGGIYLDASGGQYNNIAIRNCAAQLNGGGMYIQNTGTYLPRFTGLIITGCIASGTSTTYGSAIRYGGVDTKAEFFNMLVTNCVGQSALRLSNQNTQITIDNATFYGIYSDNPNTTTSVIETTNSATLNLYNSIIGQHAQAYAISIIANSTSYGRNNSIFGGIRTQGTWNANNSTTNTGNPGFTNAAAGDFSLTATSPVRGLGNPSYLESYFGTNNGYPAITTDIIGKARLYQGLLDLGAYQYHPPCTVPDAPVADAQVFCNAATVADLIANGTDLKWYTASTGGTALAATAALTSTTYYVSQSSGECESTRTAVDVTIGTVPSAPTASEQTFCGMATVAALSATGTNLKWYLHPTGGTSLEPDSAISTGTYYVTQSNANCESQRTPVQVTVMPLPPAPGAVTLQTFCGEATFADLESDAPETKWYATMTGGQSIPQTTPLSSGTYYGAQMNFDCESERTAVEVIVSPIPSAPTASSQTFCGTATVADLSATGTNLKWYADAISVELLSPNAVITTGTYYVSASNDICESDRTSVQVTVAALPEAPVTSAQTFCENATVSDLAATGNNLKWYNTEYGGNELSSDTQLTTGSYYVSQSNDICESTRTAVAVTVQAIPSAPTASSQTFCGTATVADLSATGTNLKWYADAIGGDVLVSGYAITTGMYYVSSSNDICESDRTSVQVTVTTLPEAPVASAQTFCGNATVSNLAATGNNLKWYNTEYGGDELSSDTQIITGTYYVSQSNDMCESTRTAVAVTVEGIPSAPTASSQTFCGTATVADLSANGTNLKWYADAIGGNVLVSGEALSTGIYYVSSSNDICESDRTSVQVTVTTLPEAPVASAQTFCGNATVSTLAATGTNLRWYRTETGGEELSGEAAIVTGTYYVSQSNDMCESTRTAVAIIVEAIPAAPTASSQTLCGTATVADLSANGTNLKWYADAMGGDVLATNHVISTGMYYVSSSNGNCESDRTAVSIIVEELPVKPSAPAQAFCGEAVVSELVASGSNIKWYTAAVGGEPLSAGTPVATGTYYVSQSSANCESPRTQVEVTINPIPSAPVADNQAFCSNPAVNGIVAEGENLRWYSFETGGDVLEASTLLNAGTYYVSQTINGCESPRTAVEITIAEILPAPVAYNQSLCASTTVADLVAEGINLKWYTEATGDSALNTSQPLASGVYYVSQTGGICESPRTAVTVTLYACSAIEESYCNTTRSFAAPIYAKYVRGATIYRFRVTSAAGTEILDRTVRYFAFNNLASYTYNTTYTIEVAVFNNGVWSPYGPACNINTPALQTSNILPQYCGTEVSFIANIYAEGIQSATAYRFRISDNGAMQYIEKPMRYFTVNEIAGYTYGKSYLIDVAVMVNGQWGAYGAQCNVLTIPLPTSQLAPGYCGGTMPTTKTVIYANGISQAMRYRFRIQSDGNVYILENTQRYFMPTSIPGNGYGKTYTVEVAVQIGGQWGEYGNACTVSMPNAPTNRPGSETSKGLPEVKQAVTITSYPNPYTETFAIAIETQSDENVTVRTFDMNGRILENITTSPAELSSVKLGAVYQEGVYNVIVTQGSYQKTFKVVRK